MGYGKISFTTKQNTICFNGSLALPALYYFDSLTAINRLYIGTTSTGAAFPYAQYNLGIVGNSLFKGKVAIGVTNNTLVGNHKLYIGGSVLCEELVVKLQANWADYVFSPQYKLKPLSEVKAYIAENSHLPDVPAACEVEEKGVATGEMLTIQMKKIEELTLYMIQMEERIKELEAQNKMLQK